MLLYGVPVGTGNLSGRLDKKKMLYYMVICYKRFMFNVLLLFSSQADRVVIGGDHFFRCRKRLKLVLMFLSLSFSIFTSL